MLFSVEQIKGVVEKGLPGAQVEVKDLTGTQDHYQVVIISDLFEGKGPVDRHRLVYGLFGSAVGAEIHALSLKTMTPKEAGSQEGRR
jgi:acid stress-induced BolA-like protein IbaG/YrbA